MSTRVLSRKVGYRCKRSTKNRTRSAVGWQEPCLAQGMKLAEVLVLASALFLAACTTAPEPRTFDRNDEQKEDDDHEPGGSFGEGSSDSAPTPPGAGCGKMDILFVLDESGSMLRSDPPSIPHARPGNDARELRVRAARGNESPSPMEWLGSEFDPADTPSAGVRSVRTMHLRAFGRMSTG